MLSTDSAENLPVHRGATELPPSFNFRDLGGLPTRAGLTLAAGRLYRSGDPAQLGLSAEDALGCAIGFRTIIDLRTSIELKQYGTGLRWPSGRHLHCPLFEVALPHWIDPADDGPRATATRYLEMLGVGTGTLVRIVRELGGRDAQPAIIHCVAGRDRTGIVIACLLDLLGVADEAIAFDYALSDRVIDDGGRAHSQTVLHFLFLLRQQYGSTLELLTAHGMSEDEHGRLLHNLLTE